MLCHVCGHLIPSCYHSKICKEVIAIQCPTCNKKFANMQYLKKHEECHNKDHVFKCIYCKMVFTRRYNLNVHIKEIHERISQLHFCEGCSSKSKRKSDLKRHFNVHSTKYYICKVCNKTFSFNHNLQRHIKTVHHK